LRHTRTKRVAELAECQLNGSVGCKVGLEDSEISAFCRTIQPDDAVVAIKFFTERAAEIAGRAGN